MDFIGVEEFNVGVLDGDPDEDDPFVFFRFDFGEFSMRHAEPQGPSKSATVGIALVDMKSGQGEKKSGRSRRRTLEYFFLQGVPQEHQGRWWHDDRKL